MSSKICPKCLKKNNPENSLCEYCKANLDLEEYIKEKKLKNNFSTHIKSVLTTGDNVDEINLEIEKFIKLSLAFSNFENDFNTFKKPFVTKKAVDELKNKYEKEVKEFNLLKHTKDLIKDADLNKNFEKIAKYILTLNDLTDIRDKINHEYINEKLNEIDEFNTKLAMLKNSNELIQKDSLSEFKSTYEFFKDIHGKSQKVDNFLKEYKSLDKTITSINKTQEIYLFNKKLKETPEGKLRELIKEFSETYNYFKQENKETDFLEKYESLNNTIKHPEPNIIAHLNEHTIIDYFVECYFEELKIDKFKELFDFIAFYPCIYTNHNETCSAKSLCEICEASENKNKRYLNDLIIANFLYAHNIDYKYRFTYSPIAYNNQKKYLSDLIANDHLISNKTSDIIMDVIYNDDTLSYKPNFYLPEYDLYLEHINVVKDNKGNYNSNIKHISNEDIIKIIVKKRGIHEKHHTKLIESWEYELCDNNLLENLAKKLTANGVEIKDIDYLSFLDKKNLIFNDLKTQIKKFLHMYVSNKSTWKMKFLNNNYSRKRQKLFLDIIDDVYNEYKTYIKLKDHLNNANMNKLIETNLSCPLCLTGDMNIEIYDNFKKIKCSNADCHWKGCNYYLDINDLIVEKCPNCGDMLVPVKETSGIFLECLNYPDCKFYKKIE